MDAFSPSAPARVRVLVLPVGKIRRSRFHTFFAHVASVSEVKLGDVTPDPRPDRSEHHRVTFWQPVLTLADMFSPLAFPDGYVLYDFTTSMTSDAELSLAPFELFREPLVVLGIADGQETVTSTEGLESISASLSQMDEQFPRMLIRKVLVFDSSTDTDVQLPKDTILVPPIEQMKSTTMRTVLCDVTSALLAEMTTLAASIKALPSIAPPLTAGAAAPINTSGTPIVSRTNSQSGERSTSPGANHQHRMSMPVLPTNSDFHGSRPDTPNSGRNTPPARTFDELVGSGSPPNGSPKPTPSNSRDISRDRVSMSGFGPGSMDERKRNQGKCRVSIVIGSLYMLAGRWREALQDLAEAAAQARSFSDHIWHAKAQENMLTCLVLLAWASVPFKIPSICYPIMDRTSSKLAAITSPTSPSPDDISGAETAQSRKELAIAIPEMANMIIGTYNRAANYTSEFLPSMAYSECIVRLCRIQTGVLAGGNTLNDVAVSYIVRNTISEHLKKRYMTAGTTRVTDMLMKAMPIQFEGSGLSAAEEASIIAGVASTLSVLGLQRKKAMLLKEYLHALIRALEDAKRSGAAEAGVHPSSNGFVHASSLVAGTAGASEGLDDFLNLLCQVYGIPESRWAKEIGRPGSEHTSLNGHAEDRDTPVEPASDFISRAFGSVNVKSDVLRTCIALCEALPDPRGVLHWTSALLKIAGPGTAPSTDTSDTLVTLSREEQLLLSSTIAKTTTDAKAMGLHNIDAEYWDEFLVRGVTLINAPEALSLHTHKKSDLLATEPKQVAKKGPFIHNPFLEKPASTNAQNLMVAGDEREFVVSLQNPYDFEIFIESIQFVAGELRFGHASSLVLRPYRTQSFSVLGNLPASGSYELEKCMIKVQGCRERAFAIFAEAWRPPFDPKVKSIGLPTKDLNAERPESDDISKEAVVTLPKSTTIPLTVIPAQGVLEVASLSLPQSSIMLLEGQSTRYRITVRNSSTSTAANFVHVSFSDSTTLAIQDALAKKNLNSAELFELEYQVKHYPAVRLVGEKPTNIEPGASSELEFEVLGKPGLTHVTILIDYANMEEDSQSTFHTRQIAVPLSVTVNASIQLHRGDVLPVASEALGGARQKEDACLLVLDFRNAWPTPLEISLQTLDLLESDTGSLPFLQSKELVQPGHIARMVLMVPKIYIKNPHARIRSANERQFVVSTNGLSVDAERVARELFWYREALLQKLQATWQQADGSTKGTIDLRNTLRLAPRMVDALKLDDVDIQMKISGTQPPKTHEIFEIPVEEFAVLETSIRNRSDVTIYPLLRLRPNLSHQPTEIALDLGKRLSWSGMLQSVVKPIPPGETAVNKLALCALCAGEYEVGATVEEIKRASVPVEEGADDSIIDPVAASAGRRTWIASKPCRIIAKR